MLLDFKASLSLNLRTLLIFFLISSSICLIGQEINGKVVNAETGEPIPFANIFFSGTLIGTTSGTEGYFKLSKFQPGKYDFVVSYIGFDEYIKTVDFIEGNMNLTLNISLKETAVELNEVHITTDTSGRNHNMKLFRDYFLGESENAKYTDITNQEVLFLYHDKEKNELFAFAKEPLKIDNNELGYRITYYLKKFQANTKTNRLESYGVPQFSLLRSDKKAKNRKWNKKREKAYNGSIVHFFSSLKEGNFIDEGFEIHQIVQVDNQERPTEELINKKLNHFYSQAFSKNKNSQKEAITISGPLADSLNYWNRMKSLPKQVDSLGSKIEDASSIYSKKTMKINYDGKLRVKYTKEWEELRYAWSVGRSDPMKHQISNIAFFDHIQLYENLFYEDVKDVVIQGYWSWSTNISELLPFNYSPEQTK